MRLHAFTCGWLSAPLGLFLEGEHGRLRVPVPAFLIDHPKGRVLFDTGLHPDVQHDAHGRLGFIADVFPADAVALAKAAVDAAELPTAHGLLEEADCFNRSLATAAARARMARFLELGGQTRAVEMDLRGLVDRLAE